jgi:hypothetical protein
MGYFLARGINGASPLRRTERPAIRASVKTGLAQLWRLIAECAKVERESADQLGAAYTLAIERGAPDDDEGLSIAPYLSTQERGDLAATIDRYLDAATAMTTIDAWTERSQAASVFEELTGEPRNPPTTDGRAATAAELTRLRDELRRT